MNDILFIYNLLCLGYKVEFSPSVDHYSNLVEITLYKDERHLRIRVTPREFCENFPTIILAMFKDFPDETVHE